MKRSKSAREIKANFKDQEEEDNKSIASVIHFSISLKAISVKGDNLRLITLAYNPVYYAQTKHIDIQYYYIFNKITTGQIKLLYILINKMIVDGLTKALTHIKFHTFVKLIKMN